MTDYALHIVYAYGDEGDGETVKRLIPNLRPEIVDAMLADDLEFAQTEREFDEGFDRSTIRRVGWYLGEDVS